MTNLSDMKCPGCGAYMYSDNHCSWCGYTKFQGKYVVTSEVQNGSTK